MGRVAATTPITFPSGVSIQRPIVENGSAVPVAVAKFQSAASHEATAKRLLIGRPSLFRVREIIRKVRADEFRARTAGHRLGGGIHVVNLAVDGRWSRAGRDWPRAGFGCRRSPASPDSGWPPPPRRAVLPRRKGARPSER